MMRKHVSLHATAAGPRGETNSGSGLKGAGTRRGAQVFLGHRGRPAEEAPVGVREVVATPVEASVYAGGRAHGVAQT